MKPALIMKNTRLPTLLALLTTAGCAATQPAAPSDPQLSFRSEQLKLINRAMEEQSRKRVDIEQRVNQLEQQLAELRMRLGITPTTQPSNPEATTMPARVPSP